MPAKTTLPHRHPKWRAHQSVGARLVAARLTVSRAPTVRTSPAPARRR